MSQAWQTPVTRRRFVVGLAAFAAAIPLMQACSSPPATTAPATAPTSPPEAAAVATAAAPAAAPTEAPAAPTEAPAAAPTEAPAAAPTAAPGATVASTGGVFIEARTTEAAGLDPHSVPALANFRINYMLYDRLIHLDQNLGVIPRLADSWEIP